MKLSSKLAHLGRIHIKFLDKSQEDMYLARYFAIIKKEKELTIDPDQGVLWERKYIDPEDFLQYVKWSEMGTYLVDKATKLFEKYKHK